MKDRIVINRLPNRVTAHSGMLSQNPTWLILSMISWGSVVPLVPVKPDWVMMVETIPCTIWNTASIRSRPYPTAAFASTNRINNLKACSGRFTSVKEPQVLTTPTAKNNTNKPYPMAFSAPLISSMTCQTPPPLKVAGSWVSNVQISVSLSFQVSNAEFRFSMIQFPTAHLLHKIFPLSGN